MPTSETDPDVVIEDDTQPEPEATKPEPEEIHEPIPEDEGSGHGYNPFDGPTVDSATPSEPFSSEASGGVHVEDDTVEADAEPEKKKDSEGTTKRRKKDADTLEEYEESAEQATYFLDILNDFLVTKKLEPHMLDGTIHPDVVARFVDSMDLREGERRRLIKAGGKYLQHEELKLDPFYRLLVVGATVTYPRYKAVAMVDAFLKEAKTKELKITADMDIPPFRAKGEPKDPKTGV